MTHLQTHLEHIYTKSELLAQGYSQRTITTAVSKKQLILLRKGIYIDRSYYQALKPWEHQLLNVLAYYRLNPQTVFSHISAAALLNLAIPLDSTVHIYAPPTDRGKVTGVFKHALLDKTTDVCSFPPGLNFTSPLQTVCDSVRFLPIQQGLALADSALYSRQVSTSELKTALLESSGRHCRKMRWLSDLVSPYAESPGESYTRFLLYEMELDFDEQVEITVGGLLYRADFRLRGLPIIVEFDGRLKLTDYGASDTVLENERRRERSLQNAGWFVFRVGWDQVVRRPAEFKRELIRLINAVQRRE